MPDFISWVVPDDQHPFGTDTRLRITYVPGQMAMGVEMWKRELCCEADNEGQRRYQYHWGKVVLRPSIDVDAILAELGDEYLDPGVDQWGGANLESCDDTCCRTHECRN